jgi:hypothetical protein
MDFQAAITNYSREFLGDLKVSRGYFVGGLGFTQGLDLPKGKAVERATEQGPLIAHKHRSHRQPSITALTVGEFFPEQGLGLMGGDRILQALNQGSNLN